MQLLVSVIYPVNKSQFDFCIRHVVFFFWTGRLHKYCRASDMPQETCFMSCNPCIKYGGVWCPSGHVVVWINGVR